MQVFSPLSPTRWMFVAGSYPNLPRALLRMRVGIPMARHRLDLAFFIGLRWRLIALALGMTALAGAAQSSVTLPISFSGSGPFTVTPVPSLGNVVREDQVITFSSSSPFEFVTGEYHGHVDLNEPNFPARLFDTSFTLFAANGDLLFGTYTVQASAFDPPLFLHEIFNGTFTFTGGTGIFAGATGGGEYDGQSDYDPGYSYAFGNSFLTTRDASITLVPEPASAILLIGGLLLLSARRSPFKARAGFVAAMLALSGAFAGRVEAAAYSLDILAQAGDTIDGQFLFNAARPSLNNHGIVAFDAGCSPCGTAGNGIFTQNQLLVKTGDVIGGETIQFINHSGHKSFNDAGTVAFAAGYDKAPTFDVGIFTQNALLVRRTDTVGGIPLLGLGSEVEINNAGKVGFNGFPVAGGSGFFTQDGPLIRGGTMVGGKALDQHIGQSNNSLNDAGKAAVFATFGGAQGMITQDGLEVQLGDTIDGKTLTGFGQSPSINDAGTIAFYADFAGGSGFFTQDDLLIQIGDVIDGLTITGFVDKATMINDLGTIAIHAVFAGGTGIFTQHHLVVRTGDVAEGRTIGGISGGLNFSLNDHDQVALGVGFNGGGTGIVLATLNDTTDVPEPATLALCGGAVAGLVFRRRRGISPSA